MRVSIYTEGGKKFGYGHIVRCLSIAQALNELGCVIEFFINGESDVESFVPHFKCHLIPWIDSPTKGSGEFFIFDSYHASLNQMQKISAGGKVLFIDDYQRFEYPQDSWVLNACPGISKELYPKNNNTLLGIQYLPLRKEFWNISRVNIRKFNDIEKILVMFGGSDMANLAPRTIRLVLEIFGDVEVITIQGASSRSLEELKSLADHEDRLSILVEPNTAELITSMCAADLAISAAGQTLQELAFMGLPTIGIQVAQNQSNNIKGWSESNVIVPLMSYNSRNFDSKLTNALKELSSPEVRRKYSLNAIQLIDGQGARRLARCVTQKT